MRASAVSRSTTPSGFAAGRVYGGKTTHIPLKVNSAGMIPLIFAVCIMVFPGMIASFLQSSDRGWVRELAEDLTRIFSPNTFQYNLIYFFMVVGFTYFYTMVVFQQQKIPENLQRQGAFVPGVRPGENTEQYLQRVLTRITLIGALFLGIVAILPFIACRDHRGTDAAAECDIAADRRRRGDRHDAAA